MDKHQRLESFLFRCMTQINRGGNGLKPLTVQRGLCLCTASDNPAVAAAAADLMSLLELAEAIQ